MVAIGLDPDDESESGRLVLDGMVYPADSGEGAVIVRASPTGRIVPIERWHTEDGGSADSATPFAMTRRGDDVIVVGRVMGEVSLGSELVSRPYGLTEPCRSTRRRRGLALVRSFVDPCRPKRWRHWGGVLRVLVGGASTEGSP